MRAKEKSDSIQILELSHSKELASILSSARAQKIFEIIKQEPQLSASEISTKTKIPLSTVQYHLKALEKTKIITSQHFKYSQKGKKVPLFSPSQQAIVIVTSPISKSRLQDVKDLLPGLLAGCIIAGSTIWGLLEVTKPSIRTSQEVVRTMQAQTTNTVAAHSTSQLTSWFPHSLLGGVMLTIGAIIIIGLSVWAWHALRKRKTMAK